MAETDQDSVFPASFSTFDGVPDPEGQFEGFCNSVNNSFTSFPPGAKQMVCQTDTPVSLSQTNIFQNSDPLNCSDEVQPAKKPKSSGNRSKSATVFFSQSDCHSHRSAGKRQGGKTRTGDPHSRCVILL
jgi:hypothetical protein